MGIIVDDERAYIHEAQYSSNGNCAGYYEKTIITKEVFVECYKKWIEEQKERKEQGNEIYNRDSR